MIKAATAYLPSRLFKVDISEEKPNHLCRGALHPFNGQFIRAVKRLGELKTLGISAKKLRRGLYIHTIGSGALLHEAQGRLISRVGRAASGEYQ
ncbi:MAG: hypothetical protein ACRES5_24790 [Pseudomonas sp.]